MRCWPAARPADAKQIDRLGAQPLSTQQPGGPLYRSRAASSPGATANRCRHRPRCGRSGHRWRSRARRGAAETASHVKIPGRPPTGARGCRQERLPFSAARPSKSIRLTTQAAGFLPRPQHLLRARDSVPWRSHRSTKQNQISRERHPGSARRWRASRATSIDARVWAIKGARAPRTRGGSEIADSRLPAAAAVQHGQNRLAKRSSPEQGMKGRLDLPHQPPTRPKTAT